jgi:hypothetical protein
VFADPTLISHHPTLIPACMRTVIVTAAPHVSKSWREDPMTAPSAAASATGYRPGPLKALRFTSLGWALVALLVQVPTAGIGLFGLRSDDFGSDGKADPDKVTSFDAHAIVGMALWAVTLVLIVLAIAARAGKTFIIISVVMFVQMFIQGPLLGAGDSHYVLGFLHPLNGVVAAMLAGYMAMKAARLLST